MTKKPIFVYFGLFLMVLSALLSMFHIVTDPAFICFAGGFFATSCLINSFFNWGRPIPGINTSTMFSFAVACLAVAGAYFITDPNYISEFIWSLSLFLGALVNILSYHQNS